jgi:tRNA modification GTPase
VLGVLEACFHADSSRCLGDCTRPSVVAGTILLPGPPAREACESLPVEIYLWPTKRSYTREPVAEIHTLGSPPLLAALLAVLCAAGARAAEPGEFTLRAFLAGRLDLTQAEAVLGLIDADGGRQFEVALAQLAGGLARPMAALRESLLDLLAELEAGLDFVEEDIEFISQVQLQNRLGDAARAVAELAARMSLRAEVAENFRAVLIGWPNVGKSSLFNRLSAGAPASLVSTVPGTTRDYLVAWLDETTRGAARRCQLIDTAGMESIQAADRLGGMAQCAAGQQADAADVLVVCLDSTRPLNAWEQAQIATPAERPRLLVLTKCDAPRGLPADSLDPRASAGAILETSALTGTGLDALRGAIHALAAGQSAGEGAVVAATATRSRESLRLAADALARAAAANSQRLGEELVAAEVRLALAEIGKVAGAVYTDDILDRVFSRFCIGK